MTTFMVMARVRAPLGALGWHRLRNAEAARLVARAEVCSHDLVLDVGAGDSAFTRALVHSGARVIAFEMRAQRAAQLRAKFAHEQVTVVRADVTDMGSGSV